MNYNNKKRTTVFFILLIFLVTSFIVNANSQDICFTNIWYKKMPNYTHLTIKASGGIEEYYVSYVESPDRIVIDVKNANYEIENLVKNILFLNMGEVKRVRCGQMKSETIPTTRFVVDLFQNAEYEVTLSPDRRLIHVDVYDYDEFKKPEEQIFTVTPIKGEDIKIDKEIVPKISLLDVYTEPINLSVFEEDIVNVIRALSSLSEIDILLDDTVTGNITLNLSDKTFRETIELILMNKRLDYAEVNDTLVIAGKEVIEGYKTSVTKIFEIKHANVENVKGILDNYKTEGSKVKIVADSRMNTIIVEGTEKEIERLKTLIAEIDVELYTKTFKIDNAIYEEEIDAIKNMLSIIIKEEERVSIDSRQREIIVEGTEEDLENVEKMILGLDKRAPQIMIEAKVAEITLDGEKDLGIKWTSGSSTDEEGNAIEGQITVGELTLGGSFERSGLIEATLKALQTEGKTNILSNPKVLTLDGKEANILSGSKIPIREITADGIETIKYMDVGLSMTLTPRLSSDGLITMDVNPKIESLGSELIQGYPIINSREESVIIRTKLGETVVIGGLITSEDIENIKKIPFLSDIPIFGDLFKFKHTKNKKTEIIILITTHLLDY